MESARASKRARRGDASEDTEACRSGGATGQPRIVGGSCVRLFTDDEIAGAVASGAGGSSGVLVHLVAERPSGSGSNGVTLRSFAESERRCFRHAEAARPPSSVSRFGNQPHPFAAGAYVLADRRDLPRCYRALVQAADRLPAARAFRMSMPSAQTLVCKHLCVRAADGALVTGDAARALVGVAPLPPLPAGTLPNLATEAAREAKHDDKHEPSSSPLAARETGAADYVQFARVDDPEQVLVEGDVVLFGAGTQDPSALQRVGRGGCFEWTAGQAGQEAAAGGGEGKEPPSDGDSPGPARLHAEDWSRLAFCASGHGDGMLVVYEAGVGMSPDETLLPGATVEGLRQLGVFVEQGCLFSTDQPIAAIAATLRARGLAEVAEDAIELA